MIGKDVRMIRRNSNTSQIQLASAVGCSVSQIRNTESGRSYPSFQISKKIAEATDSELIIGFTCRRQPLYTHCI